MIGLKWLSLFSQMTIFVTALMDLHIDDPSVKSVATRLAHFRQLAATGIPLRVFASRCYVAAIEEICREAPNVAIHRVLELEDTWTYSECVKYRDRMPVHRTATKDTFEFLTLMNAKVEFVEEVAQTCSQVAWIDFNVWHVVKDAEVARARLQSIPLVQGVYVPGCWPKAAVAWDRICWRFCGGFFVGCRAALLDFAQQYRASLCRYLESRGLAWEVNVWAQMEQEGWSPRWYKADHDDSLFAVPIADESL
jgi:hypothetical protein